MESWYVLNPSVTHSG